MGRPFDGLQDARARFGSEALALFVIALLVFRDKGKAVGVASAFVRGGLLVLPVRARTTDPMSPVAGEQALRPHGS
jgi:hypothetical protein